VSAMSDCVPVRRERVAASEWSARVAALAAADARLLALWASDERDAGAGDLLRAAFIDLGGVVVLELALAPDAPAYPRIDREFPSAARLQRAVRDLSGVVAEGAEARPWLRHGAWPADWFPLRHDAGEGHGFANAASDYAFVRVGGEGAHEIPVGPIHAGTIEPGHFRFSVIGERVLRLEQRLGYVHKGVEKLFIGKDLAEGVRLAGRVSGDSTCAYAWAYASAVEAACGASPPPRALGLRALMLERERVANHLGDLGALGNDAGLAFGLSQFMRLKEDWLRLNGKSFGHRFMMDRILPGGAALDLEAPALRAIVKQCDALGREVRELKKIYDEHAGLQDRFMGTGRATPQLAAQLGLTGLAGRASGQAADLRCDHPWPPYDRLQVAKARHTGGDVAARVDVRFDETIESLRLIAALCEDPGEGPAREPFEAPRGPATGLGWVEGWRGEVFVALELGPGGQVLRCHVHDPSWQNWPVLEHAVIGNIVPDFPLINKSFNLSYSGVDL